MASRSEKIGLVLSLFGIINIGIAIAIHSLGTKEKEPKEVPAPSASAHGMDAGDVEDGGDAEAPPTLVNADEGDAGEDAPSLVPTAAPSLLSSAPSVDSGPTPATPRNSCDRALDDYATKCGACELNACVSIAHTCQTAGRPRVASIYAQAVCKTCGASKLAGYVPFCQAYGYE